MTSTITLKKKKSNDDCYPTFKSPPLHLLILCYFPFLNVSYASAASISCPYTPHTPLFHSCGNVAVKITFWKRKAEIQMETHAQTLRMPVSQWSHSQMHEEYFSEVFWCWKRRQTHTNSAKTGSALHIALW